MTHIYVYIYIYYETNYISYKAHVWGLQLVANVPRMFLLGNKELRRNSELLIDLGVRASQGDVFFQENP